MIHDMVLYLLSLRLASHAAGKRAGVAEVLRRHDTLPKNDAFLDNNMGFWTSNL